MGKGREPRLGVIQPGALEQLDCPPPRRRAIEAEQPAKRIGQLASDREAGIERRGRVLEDHGDTPAAQVGPRGLRLGEHIVPSGESHAPFERDGRRPKQADRDQSDGGFAGTRFADQPQRLATREIEAHAIEHRMAVAGEREPGQREQGLALFGKGQRVGARKPGSHGLLRHVRFLPIRAHLGIEPFADAVADDAERDQQQGQRRPRHARDPRHDADEGGLGDHQAPIRRRRHDTQTEKGEARGDQDRFADADGRLNGERERSRWAGCGARRCAGDPRPSTRPPRRKPGRGPAEHRPARTGERADHGEADRVDDLVDAWPRMEMKVIAMISEGSAWMASTKRIRPHSAGPFSRPAARPIASPAVAPMRT